MRDHHRHGKHQNRNRLRFILTVKYSEKIVLAGIAEIGKAFPKYDSRDKEKAISFPKDRFGLILPLSYLDDLYFFINCVGVMPIYSLNCLLKK